MPGDKGNHRELPLPKVTGFSCLGAAPVSSGWRHGPMALVVEDTGEVAAERFEDIHSQQLGIFRFDFDLEIVRGAEIVPTGIGELHQRGPLVGRIGYAGDESLPFQVVDDVTGPLLGHSSAFGDHGGAGSLQVDVGQDGGVRGAELVISPGTQKLDGVRAIGAMRLEKQPADVMIAHVPDFVALGASRGHGTALDRVDNEVYHRVGQPG
jgi:hypothetical protein